MCLDIIGFLCCHTYLPLNSHVYVTRPTVPLFSYRSLIVCRSQTAGGSRERTCHVEQHSGDDDYVDALHACPLHIRFPF